MDSGWACFWLGVLASAVVWSAACLIEGLVEVDEFGEFDSKIVVFERYDPKNVESRREAVDACTGILNEKGYTLSHMEKKICGGYFVSVEGMRLKDSSSTNSATGASRSSPDRSQGCVRGKAVRKEVLRKSE